MLYEMLIHTVNVNRPAVTKDASGGQVFTQNIIASSVPCCVQPVSGKMALYYAQRNLEVSHEVYFGSDPTLEMGDILIFNGRNLRVNDYRSLIEMNLVWVVGAQELKGK
jgi:hypothetical protein